MVEHKKRLLKINCKRTLTSRSGSIKFKNHFKQLALPFKIYADFKSLLKVVKGSNKKIILHTLKNIRNTLLTVLPTKLFVLMINLVRGKNAFNRCIEVILEEYDYCNKVVKNHFNKNLIMSAEDEQRFQLSNKC